MTDENAPILYVFSNREHAPELEALLGMFLRGAAEDRIGIMQALNVTTKEEEIILVGVDLDENNKTECFPIAKLLRAEDAPSYRSPDGKGGYFNPLDPEEVESAKKGMKAVHEESLVDVSIGQ